MSHPMTYRILWTWDSWLCDPFDADSYVSEFQRLIDFMAAWGYNGLIIWGFIDDRHGGENSAKRIAGYGADKGIHIMPGVGAGGYGGFVMTPGHPYNLKTFIEKHPHLAAKVRRNPQENTREWLCLYQEESLEWLREGAAWLAQNFEIGGVNVETNEMGCIDVCPRTEAATVQEPNRLRYAASFTDLSVAVPIIYEEVKRCHDDAWVTYATYEPAWWRRQEDSWILERIPPGAIAQWNVELDVNEEMVPAPVKHNVALIHSGGWSYHLAAFPPTWAFTQYRCFYPNLKEARQFAQNLERSGFEGYVLGNVGSPIMPDNELAYIAYLAFTEDPSMTIDEFSREFIARLYGAEAEPFVKQLILAQPTVHQSVAHVYRDWSDAEKSGRGKDQLHKATQSDIEKLDEQLSLAKRAYDLASADGQRRLWTIIEVLRDYLRICRLSTVC